MLKNNEPIKQKEILEPRLQLELLKKSIIKLNKSIPEDVSIKTNYKDFLDLFNKRSYDLLNFNIVTYGLAFSTLLIFSDKFIKTRDSGMVNDYLSLMENEDYWKNTNYDDFSVEVAVLFAYQFFLNIYVECHIDFAVLNSCGNNKNFLNKTLKSIVKKINIDDSIRLGA